jgi:hypothetical protein
MAKIESVIIFTLWKKFHTEIEDHNTGVYICIYIYIHIYIA